MTSMELPDVLFHYTSATALVSILEHGELHASSLQAVNDSRELALAIERTVQLLRTEAQRQPDRIATAIEEVIRYLEHDPFTVVDDPDSTDAVCAVSLSECDNHLNQWRSYCPPEGGYAIGLRAREVLGRIKPGTLNWAWAKCVYTQAEHDAILRELVSETVNCIVGGGSNPTWFVWRRLLQVAPRLKDSHFEPEQEWRLFAETKTRCLDVKAGRAKLVPYSRLEFIDRHLPIARIVVGPQSHQQTAELGVRAALARYQCREQVERSQIPYRLLL
jgi:hypothetical protein